MRNRAAHRGQHVEAIVHEVRDSEACAHGRLLRPLAADHEVAAEEAGVVPEPPTLEPGAGALFDLRSALGDDPRALRAEARDERGDRGERGGKGWGRQRFLGRAADEAGVLVSLRTVGSDDDAAEVEPEAGAPCAQAGTLARSSSPSTRSPTALVESPESEPSDGMRRERRSPATASSMRCAARFSPR